MQELPMLNETIPSSKLSPPEENKMLQEAQKQRKMACLKHLVVGGWMAFNSEEWIQQTAVSS